MIFVLVKLYSDIFVFWGTPKWGAKRHQQGLAFDFIHLFFFFFVWAIPWIIEYLENHSIATWIIQKMLYKLGVYSMLYKYVMHGNFRRNCQCGLFVVFFIDLEEVCPFWNWLISLDIAYLFLLTLGKYLVYRSKKIVNKI